MVSTTFTIRMKFITGLVLFTLALGLCLGVTMYFHFNSIMESEISQRSRMLLAQSDAVQDYVKTVLRPEMFRELPEDSFLIKAMSSSYISREIMDRLSVKDDITYHYRRVAKNARNKASAPNEVESDLIRMFNADRDMKRWEDDTLVNGEKYHLIARPIRFGESCMHCHGEPATAPKELLEIYGNTGGFHYTVGEIGGVVIAGFPVEMIKNPVKEVTFQYITLYLLGIFFFASLISLFFDRLVMKNLHHLSLIFKTRFSGEQEQGIIEKLGKKDEIEGLIEGVDELALCLSKAKNELEDYALNLENKVKTRTKDLIDTAEKHHGDVNLFLGLLSGFANAEDTGELIHGVLDSIAGRFDADQVVYHCTVVSENYYCWKQEARRRELKPDIKEILWNDEILRRKDRVYIPVKSHESHFGILCISWSQAVDHDDLDPSVLIAMGQQVGILIENIQAISNIRFQNDMLQSVFEGISDPLLLIDTMGHILMANKGSTAILGTRSNQDRELETFLGMDARPMEPTGQNRSGKDLLHRVIENEEPGQDEIRTRDGRYFKTYLYPLPRHDRSNLRMVLYAREITLEKKMMSRMQQAERLGAIGKLAAGIAHEINNPLGVIQCYTDLVKDAVADEGVNEDIDVIVRQTRNVKKIVQDLLTLSRPKQVISGRCDINQVAAAAIHVFKAQAASKSIRVLPELGDNLPPIKCDAAILEQILTNIWLNAFDALQETGGEVIISTRAVPESNEVLLCIEDNGPGIPDHVIDQIFDLFYTTKEVGKGTGLGLSIVYGFINELGGRIEVANEGTTRFRLYFPAVRAKE